ncbi:leucine-rich transmembrane protein 3, partial [Sarcoptes scabiei]
LASGTFQQLYNLKHLSLAHNRLNTITTRLFYNLTSLRTLDLSHNPLGEISPKNMIDLRPLKQLSMVDCEITQIHSLFYRNLPNLEILNLSNNRMKQIHPFEFGLLKNLVELYLDQNQMNQIGSYAFVGLNLKKLSLSKNDLRELNANTFTNSSVEDLNLSENVFEDIDPNLLAPFGSVLKSLKFNQISTLSKPSLSVSKLLLPLKNLEKIELSNLKIDSIELKPDLFINNYQTLKSINMSHNSFVNISSKLFEGLHQLEILDLSHNSLYELGAETLHTLSMFRNLSMIFFDNNPWSCYRCHLLYFRTWITMPKLIVEDVSQANQSDNLNRKDFNNQTDLYSNAYQQACRSFNRCAICSYPANLEGTQVDDLEEWQLEWCTDPTVQLRVSTTEP